jgi:hypothetical protein
MGIADLFRPKYRHSDVRVRTQAVKALTADDAAILVQVARTDSDIGVRRLAIGKIDEANVLAEIAAAETERSLRDFAGERAAQLWSSHACSDDEEEANQGLGGIIKLGDQHALVEVAVNAAIASVRKRAFGELRDPRALAELAKGDAPQDLRLAAVARIDDGDVLRAIAIDTTLKEVGLAAVDKLEDTDRLENVAQKAKNKGVRQRARKILAEMQEAERARAKPAVPDDVKRRRAEKAQLIREVEAVADTFDFDKVSAQIKAAEEAWLALGGPKPEGAGSTAAADEGDDRFKKATERFWKRKEIYDQQARSGDELRAIEREAQRAKARAAAEREQEARPAEVEAKPEPAVSDEERAARDAEATAQREEREKRKAEDDARRAAEQAEREARRKEDAERSVALGASLAAMCEDMEKLADSGSKDGRAIDRLLQQAAKGFEQLGKVPAEQRDALGDRYTAARGKLVVRASELREAEDWQRFANVPKAEALIETAKSMATEEPSQDLGNRLRQLQALWKEVGPMPQRRSKELWEQFKTICDQIYDKVKGYRAVEGEKFAEVAKVKEDLIAQAEALADSTDWAATAQAIKGLQARWKESGHVPRKQGDELWKRFRAACDRFFERRKPQLEAQHAEEADNLAKKQALIARAQAVADAAPGEGGWGKSIAEIKNLQQQWKEIGFVPRRDADAVYKAFRAACDSLFEKRDDARDAEANQHRDAIEAVKNDIADALLAGDESVARAVAIRAKARELDSRELATAVEQLVRHVISSHPEAVKGTELDPAAARNRRDKLIAKVEELLPKQAPAMTADTAPADIAAQLKQAMRSNAFGDLRFSGRDPVEVVDELRTQWIEAGPVLDDADNEQQTRFDELTKRVLDAAGVAAKQDRDEARSDRGVRDDRDDRGDKKRRRRERRPADAPQNERAMSAPRSSSPSFAASAQTAASSFEARPAAAGFSAEAAASSFGASSAAAAASESAPSSFSAEAAPSSFAAEPAPSSFAAEPAPSSFTAQPSPSSYGGSPSIPSRADTDIPAAAATVVGNVPAAIPQSTTDAITAPAKYPFEPLPPPPMPATTPAPALPVSAAQEAAHGAEPMRARPTTNSPPIEEIDEGWDLGDDDPTAASDETQSASADAEMERPANTPSSSEMAGDSATGGDGIDEPGWD